MRWIGVGLAGLLAMWGNAAAEDFTRGEFKFSTGDAPAFVAERPLPQQWPAAAPGADDAQWRYWRYDRQVDHREGQKQAYVDYAYEARSQGNVANAGRFEIAFNPDYQTLVLHRVDLRRNGQWSSRLKPADISIARRERQFEQDIADGQVAALIVIEDVRPQDVVRLSYTIRGENPILQGQTSDVIQLAYGNPILDVRLRTLYPAGTEVAVYREHGAQAPVVERLADRVEARIEAAQVDRIIDEGDYPSGYQPYPLVHLAAKRTWADVVAWALPLYPDQTAERLPDDLERRLAEWKRIRDPQARLQAALRAVQDDVRYFGVETGTSSHRPRPPHLVWTRRYGDCKDKAWLLVTLLERLDIRAVPALVNTERGDAIGGYAPSADVFDHVIVRAEIGGKPVFVDPTMHLQGGLPERGDLSSYGMVLPVAAGNQALQRIEAPQGAIAGISTAERYTPDGDGLRLEVSTEYRGSSADQFRRSISEERPEDRARRYGEVYSKRTGSPITSLHHPEISDDRDGNIIKVTEAYRLAQPWQGDAQVRRLDVSADSLSRIAELPARTQRSGPLYLGRPGRYVHDVELQAPAGWSARFSREEERVNADAFDYVRTLELKDSGMHLRHEFEVRKRSVAVAQVAEHIGSLRKVGEGLNSRLQYKLPAGAGADDREKRLRNLLQDAMEGK